LYDHTAEFGWSNPVCVPVPFSFDRYFVGVDVVVCWPLAVLVVWMPFAHWCGELIGPSFGAVTESKVSAPFGELSFSGQFLDWPKFW